jgi:[acyl-carrier-protein] S-malonyltransferase
MREAANRLAQVVAGLDWRAPSIPVVQNVDAAVHGSVEAIAEALVRQLYLPVQWTRCVQALAGMGATTLVECGPGKVLTGLAKRIDKSLVGHSTSTPADFDAALSGPAA